ncbi:MFS transporter [Streptomyces sp. NPDC058470]|uniref:MFS transporter n=1 Tax=Streptomyces sp. NPDC058470 TaxID=3346515 RepID=UPI0036494EB7
MPRAVVTRPPTARPPGRREARALAVLGLSAFVVGTAEFVVVGVLDRISTGLHVSVGTVGLLVTAYALGVCVGGPALTALTIRLPRRFLLCAALALYTLANGMAAVADGFTALLVVRAVAGAVHGLFVGVASAAAASLVGPDRKGRAVAVVFGGIAAANLLGVPLATYAGHVLPWQWVFAGIAVLGCVALGLTLAVVPEVANSGHGALGAQTRHVLTRPALLALGTGVLLFCGQFTVFTLLGTYLQRITGVSGGAVGVFLLVFGAAGSVGTLVGGRFADRDAGTTLVVAGVVLTADLGVLFLVGGHPVPTALALAVFGLFGFGLAPALQLRTIELAGPGGDLASTLGASAGNAGIAAGSALAGWFGTRYGVAGLPLAAAGICGATLPLVWALRRMKPPRGVAGVSPGAPDPSTEVAVVGG